MREKGLLTTFIKRNSHYSFDCDITELYDEFPMILESWERMQDKVNIWNQ